jgi:hypothetical protein
VFAKGLPNNISFYPISFAQSSPFLTYIGELKKDSILTYKLLVWGSLANLFVPFGDGPINMQGNPSNE